MLITELLNVSRRVTAVADDVSRAELSVSLLLCCPMSSNLLVSLTSAV